VTVVLATAALAFTSHAQAQSRQSTPVIVVEQDGKRIEPTAGDLRVRRAPFTPVFRIPVGTEVTAHASSSPAAYELSRSGKPLDSVFADGGTFAIDTLNTSRTLFLSGDDPPSFHAWYFENDRDHTFDSVTVQGPTLVARFTVAVLAMPDPAQYTVERFPGREVYLTLRVVRASSRAEVGREAVRIVLEGEPTSRTPPATSPDQSAREQAPVRLSDKVPAPKKLKHVDPVYPEAALKARIQGTVVVEALIGEDGTVKHAEVIRSVPLLDPAALEAVRQWVFEPVRISGVPTPLIMTLTVTFSLR